MYLRAWFRNIILPQAQGICVSCKSICVWCLPFWLRQCSQCQRDKLRGFFALLVGWGCGEREATKAAVISRMRKWYFRWDMVYLMCLFAECLHWWLWIYLHLAAGAKSLGEFGALQAVSWLHRGAQASQSKANWHLCKINKYISTKANGGRGSLPTAVVACMVRDRDF